GRHRFTKENINDFLHPSVQRPVQPVEVKEPSYHEISKQVEHKNDKEEETKEVEKAPIKDEPVDWLARFRQAAEKYKSQELKTQEAPSSAGTSAPIIEFSPKVWDEPKVEKVEEGLEESEFTYYRSGVGGLKEIAQSLDKSAKNASLDYAFTMQAGLSLHKPIKPFSLIHAYIRPGDRSYFEKVLQLTPSTKDTAQLCLATSNVVSLYKDRKEMHGLQVVSDEQIKLDLLNEGETDLANELE
ncbi:MAG: hypothetical protein WC988_04420, partial [Patescibacteria group bacterium]